jgi:hypothetical protein
MLNSLVLAGNLSNDPEYTSIRRVSPLHRSTWLSGQERRRPAGSKYHASIDSMKEPHDCFPVIDLYAPRAYACHDKTGYNLNAQRQVYDRFLVFKQVEVG